MTEPLKPAQAAKAGEQTPGWEIGEKSIERTFRFKNFVAAMDFANKITAIAEEENHHPDLHISWGKVRVELSTHSVGGLSINDFIVAAKINKLLEQT
jgi:4a-hydroxytetrahydrobiopterin dehydratase